MHNTQQLRLMQLASSALPGGVVYLVPGSGMGGGDWLGEKRR